MKNRVRIRILKVLLVYCKSNTALRLLQTPYALLDRGEAILHVNQFAGTFATPCRFSASGNKATHAFAGALRSGISQSKKFGGSITCALR